VFVDFAIETHPNVRPVWFVPFPPFALFFPFFFCLRVHLCKAVFQAAYKCLLRPSRFFELRGLCAIHKSLFPLSVANHYPGTLHKLSKFSLPMHSTFFSQVRFCYARQFDKQSKVESPKPSVPTPSQRPLFRPRCSPPCHTPALTHLWSVPFLLVPHLPSFWNLCHGEFLSKPASNPPKNPSAFLFFRILLSHPEQSIFFLPVTSETRHCVCRGLSCKSAPKNISRRVSSG